MVKSDAVNTLTKPGSKRLCVHGVWCMVYGVWCMVCVIHTNQTVGVPPFDVPAPPQTISQLRGRGVFVYGMLWCGVIWRGMVCKVWRGMVWYGMVWYGMVYGIWYMVWYGIWCGMIWYGMIWYGMVWYGVVWCIVIVSCDDKPCELGVV